MRVFKRGKNYSIVCERETDELVRLDRGEYLEARVIKCLPIGNLDKKVVLQKGETLNNSGIDISYLPKGCNWNSALEVHVIINQVIYQGLIQHGRAIFNYGNRWIRILDGMQALA